MSSLPWKPTPPGKVARKREEQLAKDTGGRRVAGSGSKREKGDVRTATQRIEDKYTDSSSYSITLATLSKIEREAILTPPGLTPVLRVTLARGTPRERTVRIYREEDCD